MSIARSVSVLALVAGAVLMGPMVGCTGERSDVPAAMATELVPAKLGVDGPVVARVHATGVQVYTAEVGKDGVLAWALTAPDATFDGDCKGKHYKGPIWECSSDGSKVEGHRLDDAPAPVPDAIPWLLLEAKSHSGTGRFSEVTFIQRLNTAGRKAPASA